MVEYKIHLIRITFIYRRVTERLSERARRKRERKIPEHKSSD